MQTIYHIVQSLKSLQGLFLHSSMAVQTNLNKCSKHSSPQVTSPSTLVFSCQEKPHLRGSCGLALYKFQYLLMGSRMKPATCLSWKSNTFPGIRELRKHNCYDEQHLTTADLLAKGNMTFKQLGAFYGLYGVWVPCILQDLVRDFLQFGQISLATKSLKLLSLHTDPFPF